RPCGGGRGGEKTEACQDAYELWVHLFSPFLTWRFHRVLHPVLMNRAGWILAASRHSWGRPRFGLPATGLLPLLLHLRLHLRLLQGQEVPGDMRAEQPRRIARLLRELPVDLNVLLVVILLVDRSREPRHHQLIFHLRIKPQLLPRALERERRKARAEQVLDHLRENRPEVDLVTGIHLGRNTA